MGAKTFVHYSFPRHMSQELLARRRDIMKEEAAKHGHRGSSSSPRPIRWPRAGCPPPSSSCSRTCRGS